MEAWIAQIRFPPEVEAKIREKHNLTAEAVRDAVALGAALRIDWHTHPAYGRRLIATGTTADNREIVVYLRPVDRDEEVWDCLTAMPTED